MNYGLSILKTILSFYVVKTHCLKRSTIENKILLYILGKDRGIHVPSFFNMSFYFNYKCLISKDPERNRKRFERLLIPYIFWPIIVFSINKFSGKYYKSFLEYPFKKIIIQIILGNGIINPLWFQCILLATSLVFLIIIYIFENYYLFALQILMILSYILQYSKYNQYFFENLTTNCQMSFGREIMMIPFAVTGFHLAAFKIINKLKYYRFKSFIFSVITFIFVDNFNIFYNLDNYNGIKLNVLSIALIFIFSLLPVEKGQNNKSSYNC